MSDLADLSGNGNDGTPTAGTNDSGPVLCAYDADEGQWAFFPGWEDEGASTDPITPTGVLDVRWDSDPLSIDVGTSDWHPVHLGSDADALGFTVRFVIGTGLMEMRWSDDGANTETVTAGAAPAGGDSGQRRITRDPSTGTVTFYERTSGDLASDSGWTQVSQVSGSSGAINTDASQSLAISGPTTGATWDAVGQNFGGHLRRLLILDDSTIVTDFDPTLASRPFASFAGGAGETWTFHRAETTVSYRVDIVDRTCVMVGNGAHFDMGDVLDAGTGPVTVVHAFWHQTSTPAFNGLIGKTDKDLDPTDDPNYGLGQADNIGGGPGTGGLLAVAGDGADTALALDAGTPAPPMGTVSVVAEVLDRATDEVRVYVDGVEQATADASAVGDTGSASTFKIGVYANGSQQAWLASAVFLRELTDEQLAALTADVLTTYPIPHQPVRTS